MRVVLQRVLSASVAVDGLKIAQINKGLLLFLGISENDEMGDLEWLVKKVIQLRIFDDENGQMNKSVTENENNEILVISQFTLFASTKKGNRPSYLEAAKPEKAIPLYEKFVLNLNSFLPNKIKKGKFGADMKVELLNDGPVTIFIDTKNKE